MQKDTKELNYWYQETFTENHSKHLKIFIEF